MRRTSFLLPAVLAILGAAQPVIAQKFLPKSIQFKGDPEYTDQELMDAAGLKKGTVLSYADMNDVSKRLVDTGVFATLAFKFDGQDLIFQLTPRADLYPIHLENLPLAPGTDLDARLHEQIPLYHGKVPADGGLNDDVRAALEKMLTDEGVKANVLATWSSGQAPGKGGYVGYSITTPPVVVGEIRLGSKSAALEPGAQEILTKLTGSPFSEEGTPSQISTYLGNYYRDKGYVEAAAEAAPLGVPTVAGDMIKVPFEVNVTPGIQYRLAGVQLPPDMVVTQADFDKQAYIHPGDIADGQHVIENWEFIARQCHNHGYMKARVHPTPSFDRALGTVKYVVTADPGPVYSMGTLTIENVEDKLRAAMLAAWKMPAGAVFNESAVRNFYAIGDANEALKRVFAAVNCKYVLSLNDASHTVDVVLRLEKKQ
jgi:outer membrane protein insertion porin family